MGTVGAAAEHARSAASIFEKRRLGPLGRWPCPPSDVATAGGRAAYPGMATSSVNPCGSAGARAPPRPRPPLTLSQEIEPVWRRSAIITHSRQSCADAWAIGTWCCFSAACAILYRTLIGRPCRSRFSRWRRHSIGLARQSKACPVGLFLGVSDDPAARRAAQQEVRTKTSDHFGCDPVVTRGRGDAECSAWRPRISVRGQGGLGSWRGCATALPSRPRTGVGPASRAIYCGHRNDVGAAHGHECSLLCCAARLVVVAVRLLDFRLYRVCVVRRVRRARHVIPA